MGVADFVRYFIVIGILVRTAESNFAPALKTTGKVKSTLKIQTGPDQMPGF